MAKNYFDLTGKTAVVTGASAGLGVQMANALASQGASIVCLARRKELCEENAAAIRETYGVDAIGVGCDIKDTALVESAIKEVLNHFGRIDILVNNAGNGSVARAEETTDEEFDNELQVDLFGSFRMARAVANAAMIPQEYGRIINIASIYGLVGNNVAPASGYHAAKGALVNLTRSLAAEWGSRGITVNAICPGYFETPSTKDTLDSDFFQNYAKTMIPLARYGKEGELDTAALFFASDASSYVNGVILPVDGGYTCM